MVPGCMTIPYCVVMKTRAHTTFSKPFNIPPAKRQREDYLAGLRMNPREFLTLVQGTERKNLLSLFELTNIFQKALAVGPNTDWTATASSTLAGNFAPSFAIDGIDSTTNDAIFHNGEINQMEWLQIDLGTSYYVKAVEVIHISEYPTHVLLEKYKEVWEH